jgi:hypothetical protein
VGKIVISKPITLITVEPKQLWHPFKCFRNLFFVSSWVCNNKKKQNLTKTNKSTQWAYCGNQSVGKMEYCDIYD